MTADQSPVTRPTKSFDWERQWYPVAVVADLDRQRPHPTKLLNKDLVMWWDGSQWNAMRDRCPHRLAALSGMLVGSTP